ncbi:MAG: hypothetical protein HZC05_00640 [Candidatus Magasanikbacteria bacterium]|nr:hypothetical protein [Candidatus Magasanikbacteria bacterium]
MPLIKKERQEEEKPSSADFLREAPKPVVEIDAHKESELSGPVETEARQTTETTQLRQAVVSTAPTSIHRPTKDPHLVEVENILSAGLEDAYKELTPELKIKFKLEGERVSGLVWQMVETAKIKVQKIVDMIRNWLKMIPRVNHFFLEQETKIKTDKIIFFAKKHKEE